MSMFLDILIGRVDNCGIGDLESYLPIGLVDEHQSRVDKTIQLIDSLGENARKLLEIGIVQDELVKLGFYSDGISRYKYLYQIPFVTDKGLVLGEEVYFTQHTACIINRSSIFYYATPFWQTALINGVKELINENKRTNS